MLQLVVFGSNRGSNYEAILQSIEQKRLSAAVVCMITNNPQARMIAISQKHGIPAHVCDSEPEIISVLANYEYDLIALAGYMKILSKKLIVAVGKPIINIHPSLLPSFKGLHPQRQALEYGVKYTGCTVHVVTPDVDSGRILGQRIVSVFPDDTVESLSTRILQEEHELYSSVLMEIAQGDSLKI